MSSLLPLHYVYQGGGKVGWQRHDKADSISTTIFGNLVVTDVELQDSGEALSIPLLSARWPFFSSK